MADTPSPLGWGGALWCWEGGGCCKGGSGGVACRGVQDQARGWGGRAGWVGCVCSGGAE